VEAVVPLPGAVKQLKGNTPLDEDQKQALRDAVTRLDAAVSQLPFWGPEALETAGSDLRRRMKILFGSLFSWSNAVAHEPDQPHRLTERQEQARREELEGWRADYLSELASVATMYKTFVRRSGDTLRSPAALVAPSRTSLSASHSPTPTNTPTSASSRGGSTSET
jgi:hypothetical protein